MTRTLDITPSPRVLRMLGQIDFAPWQCLAELIDNSVDAFIDEQRSGRPIANPRIHIQLPTYANVADGKGVISIEDNASGMTVDQLQNAVKAGYSGNDPVDKMGLFGMGFNISTARLGRRTEILTTRADAAEWTRIVIDFDDLERKRTFQTPIETVRKTDEQLQRPTHGTKINISRLEAERIAPLTRGTGKARTRQRLGKIYGRVMNSLGITINYDGDRVVPWRHCVWNAARTVPTAEFAQVPARIDIDEKLSPRRFCTTCWVWLTESDTACSSCGHNEQVIERPRSVRGWIGVQRYFDKEHYGIDLIRNGRVIEELDKSFFTFRDANGDELFEYPRDAMHWGGRIVGELEIDFVRVSHQKDSFDKLDPEWKHVATIVRGDSPLQPKIAQNMGLARNTSPLARLFAGYRKGKAGLKDLVPADSSGNGLNSGPVKDYVDRFYNNEADYQEDTRWYELVLQAERSNRGGSSGAEEAGGPIPIGGTIEPPPPLTYGSRPLPAGGVASPKPLLAAEQDSELSQVYELDFLPGSPAITVQAYRHADASSHLPCQIAPDGVKVRYDYYPKASFFEESLVTPVDCFVVDLAQHFLVVAASSPRVQPISKIAYEIRKRYFPQTLSDVDDSSDAAEDILAQLRACFDESLPSCAPIDPNTLDQRLVEQVRARAFNADSATEEQVERMLREGRFARHVDSALLIELVQRWPKIACDGAYFSLPYAKIARELQENALASLTQTLQDLRWLAEEASSAVSKDNNWRLRYARALASLRLAESWID